MKKFIIFPSIIMNENHSEDAKELKNCFNHAKELKYRQKLIKVINKIN